MKNCGAFSFHSSFLSLHFSLPLLSWRLAASWDTANIAWFLPPLIPLLRFFQATEHTEWISGLEIFPALRVFRLKTTPGRGTRSKLSAYRLSFTFTMTIIWYHHPVAFMDGGNCKTFAKVDGTKSIPPKMQTSRNICASMGGPRFVAARFCNYLDGLFGHRRGAHG